MPTVSSELVADILASDAPYSSQEQKQICSELVEKLSDDEKEEAAQTSYAYSIAPEYTEPPTAESRLKMAMRFARRHLVAEQGDTNLALTKMKSTLQWRKENHINDLRRCYGPFRDDDDEELMADFRRKVEAEHSLQKSYISGFDKDDSALMIKYARTNPECEQPDHLIATCYMTERGIACAEFASVGREEKLLTVCDFNLYKVANSPKKESAKVTIKTLQAHYPERLKHYYIVWCEGGRITSALIRMVWGVVQLFLDPDTKEKVQFLCSKKKRDEVVSKSVGTDQSMPFMLTGGAQTNEVDMNTFLRDCPFTCSANEKF